MGVAVYANGMSIACKADDGKCIAAMPDVCLSPPSPPAGPLPLPYPNTAMASDTDQGSKTVQIGGKPVMLKDQSVFKTSSGNEAATKSFGMSVITHQIQGKASFVAWSMDVKFEGQNVPRHLDLMGLNEASTPPSPPPWPFMSSQKLKNPNNPCHKDASEVADNCKCGGAPEDCYSAPCCSARRCMLVPKKKPCCPKSKPKTGHHVVPESQFLNNGGLMRGMKKYSYEDAPCICATGKSHSFGQHGRMHTLLNKLTMKAIFTKAASWITKKTISDDARWTVDEAETAGAKAAASVMKCNEDCIKQQVRKGHSDMGVNKNGKIRPRLAGKRPDVKIVAKMKL